MIAKLIVLLLVSFSFLLAVFFIIIDALDYHKMINKIKNTKRIKKVRKVKNEKK